MEIGPNRPSLHNRAHHRTHIEYIYIYMYVRDPDSLTGPFLVSGALFFYYSTRRRLARTHAMAIKFKHEGQRILLFALFHFPTFGRRRSVIWMYGNSSRPHPLGSNTALPLCIYMCV